MRTSQLNLSTLRETPAEAEIVSHQLMLRAGLIKRLAAGLFTWMPVGWRVVRKVEQVVREEMDRAGALEIMMPAVQPAELWQESQRWDKYGPLLLRMQDRHDRDYCFGPTHEEVITDLARKELKSYRQLPISYYQIQTKFRDEIRPRFGVMRAREFLMKDAYSFHLDQPSLQTTYDRMADAYSAVFTRLGLKFRAVDADSGEIGGSRSQEFHVLAAAGEDAIAYCDEDDFAANLEACATTPSGAERAPPSAPIETIDTPGAKTIDAVAEMLNVAATDCVKTIVVEGESGPIALVVRGDHEINTIKAQALAGVSSPLTLAPPEAIVQAGTIPGFVGPIGLGMPVFVDHAAAELSDFVCGANSKGQHLRGVNWGRDIDAPTSVDLRNAVDGDPTPGGHGTLSIARGIEVGHIFQLGTTYAEAMQATVQDHDGNDTVMTMGCYGIGVSRIVAAAIEQNHDDNGIVWPGPMAPWQVALVPINAHQSEDVTATTEWLYEALTRAGIDTLLDDRDARPGVKFKDMELLGIPHRVVISPRGIDSGTFEYRARTDPEARQLKRDEVLELLVSNAIA